MRTVKKHRDCVLDRKGCVIMKNMITILIFVMMIPFIVVGFMFTIAVGGFSIGTKWSEKLGKYLS